MKFFSTRPPDPGDAQAWRPQDEGVKVVGELKPHPSDPHTMASQYERSRTGMDTEGRSPRYSFSSGTGIFTTGTRRNIRDPVSRDTQSRIGPIDAALDLGQFIPPGCGGRPPTSSTSCDDCTRWHPRVRQGWVRKCHRSRRKRIFPHPSPGGDTGTRTTKEHSPGSQYPSCSKIFNAAASILTRIESIPAPFRQASDARGPSGYDTLEPQFDIRRRNRACARSNIRRSRNDG